jgi:hypothetical protein
MLRRLIWTLGAVALVCACNRASPEMQVINDAAAALGGAERIAAVKTLTMVGEGYDLAVGGSQTPVAPQNSFRVTEYSRTLDIEHDRARVKQIRTAQFPFALAVVTAQDLRLDGEIAYNVGGAPSGDGAPPQPTRAPAAVVRARRLEMLQHPLAIVRAALDPAARVTNLREEDNQPHVDITTAKGDVVTLAIDPSNKLPTHVSYPAYDPNWGDIIIEAQFSSYADVNGLNLPTHVVTKQDHWTTTVRQIATNTLNADASELAAPDEVKSAAPPTPPPVDVTAEQVGKGIWWLAGSSHRSVVFEFDDHLVLFEVPLNDARTLAVIARARTLVPTKPLTHAIVSHHHLDHAGGFRAAVSEDLTIITHRDNETFFKEIASRKHTRALDTLAKNPKTPQFEIVDDQLTLKDKSMEVQLYHVVKDNTHMSTALFAYVPRDRLLIQADLFDNGWLWQPWGDNFLANLALRKLRVDRHVPIHGPIQTHAEVLRTLKEKPKGPPTS